MCIGHNGYPNPQRKGQTKLHHALKWTLNSSSSGPQHLLIIPLMSVVSGNPANGTQNSLCQGQKPLCPGAKQPSEELLFTTPPPPCRGLSEKLMLQTLPPMCGWKSKATAHKGASAMHQPPGQAEADRWLDHPFVENIQELPPFPGHR